MAARIKRVTTKIIYALYTSRICFIHFIFYLYNSSLGINIVYSNTIILQEQFESSRTDFGSEVELLSKIDHRSLVKLLGYVDHANERIIITEYVGNGTLREHLDGNVSTYEKLEIKLFDDDGSIKAH